MNVRALAVIVSTAVLSPLARALPSIALAESDLSGVIDGPDAALIQSGAIQSFDVTTQVEVGDDWSGLDIDVAVSAYGQSLGVQLWHATDQRDDLYDPNDYGAPNGNLSVPFLPRAGTHSREYDTFVSGGGNEVAFVRDHTMYVQQPVVSDATDIHSFWANGTRMPVYFACFTQGFEGEIHNARLSFLRGSTTLTTEEHGEPVVTIFIRSFTVTYVGTERSFYLYAAPAPPCIGDFNNDGSRDSEDLAILIGNFGTTSGATLEDGDVDGDGDIDSTDLAALLDHFGAPCPA